MNNCSKCNKQPSLPPATLEIINQCDPVLFHKVIFPAALGDDTTVPPDTLNYKNVLLVYAANEHAYLYSSDGAATFISMAAVDLTAIKQELAQHGIDIDNLKTEVATLQGDVETLQNSLAEETQNRQDADENLQDQITTNTQNITSLNTAVTSQGEQINNLETNLQDTTTELQTDIANEALVRTEADDTLQSNIDAINANLNQEIEKETDFTTDSSTVTVQHTKVNLSNNDTNITTDPLPVANETQAGVMNTSMFQALQNNSENIDSILNGAVALTGISAEATQEELTTAWETATGKTSLINRASIYDITNSKVWYYYDNISQWEPVTATGEGEVSISTFTNTTPGIIKGSENDGQVFAEADGTGSVVGWDGVKHDVENIVELLETNPIPKLYDAYGTNTDGALTQNFLNTALRGSAVYLGQRSTSSSVSDAQKGIAIGYNAQQTSSTSGTTGSSIAIGPNSKAGNSASPSCVAVGVSADASKYRGESAFGGSALANGWYTTALGYGATTAYNHDYSVALGYAAKTGRGGEVSIGDPNAAQSGQYPAPKTRYLANVKAGVYDTDAVNVKQLKDYVGTNVPPAVIVATPTIDVEGDFHLIIDGPGGLTEPTTGTIVLLQALTNTISGVNLPFILDDGIKLAYAGGQAYPIKYSGFTNPVITSYENLLGIYAYSQYLLMFDGTEWLVLMPQNPYRYMTPAEFNAAWEAA